MQLCQGAIGEANAKLLGALVTTKLFLTALARQSRPEQERTDHYLYLDECQAFSTTVLGSILSESRKYRLNLTLSHQFLDQLDKEIVQSILGNVGTIIAFRLGSLDAETLAPEFTPECTATDLQQLERYQIYLKLSVNGQTRRPFSARTLPPPEPARHERNRENILATSRLRYAARRTVVEEKIQRWMADTPRKSGGRVPAPTKAFVVS